MQTKNQIRQLLESAGLEPNKHLGQHFLIDLNLMQLLVDSADIQKDDLVMEVGCGTGSLTSLLVQKANRVIAVEYDHNLFGIAKSQLKDFANLDIINTDILKNKNSLNDDVIELLSSALKEIKGKFLLVANLPYHVASPLMINLVTSNIKADGMFVTVQKEVAQRMKADFGSGDYGILSIILNATGDVELFRVLKPGVFWPKPQVDSAMVKYISNSEKIGKIPSLENFVKIVHLFMNHRRKTLHAISKLEEANLIGVNSWDEIFDKCSIDSHQRPDKITPEQYVSITHNIKSEVDLILQ